MDYMKLRQFRIISEFSVDLYSSREMVCTKDSATSANLTLCKAMTHHHVALPQCRYGRRATGGDVAHLYGISNHARYSRVEEARLLRQPEGMGEAHRKAHGIEVR